MIRNMDLVRKILIAVEEQYEDTVIYKLKDTTERKLHIIAKSYIAATL